LGGLQGLNLEEFENLIDARQNSWPLSDTLLSKKHLKYLEIKSPGSGLLILQWKRDIYNEHHMVAGQCLYHES
jgi:hypothetical protein